MLHVEPTGIFLYSDMFLMLKMLPITDDGALSVLNVIKGLFQILYSLYYILFCISLEEIISWMFTIDKYILNIFLFYNFVNNCSSISLISKDGVICDLCQENAAVRICLTCNDLFCEPDALQHSKDMQKHILKDIGNEAHGRCCQHQKSKDFYCRTDQMHICSSCVEGYHKKHDILSPRTMRQVSLR